MAVEEVQIIPDDAWPPAFTLDQERILNLLIGDRFYTNPSAALREAVLNAIDAVYRRRKGEPDLVPQITVTFNRSELTLEVSDNGVGMSRSAVSTLFTKVGSSAAEAESKKDSVGEFGIGVISYFMAGDGFILETYDGTSEPVGLKFSRQMLAGGSAVETTPIRTSQGTTLTLALRSPEILSLLVKNFSHWCRDVDGLVAVEQPNGKLISQGSVNRASNAVEVEHPSWIERSHLGPVSDPTGWEAMTGESTVAVLYRGVFVQEFMVRKVWGIKGSIDVDPKHFKPRLNREGFIEGQFQAEVEDFLKAAHPRILEAMAQRLAEAVEKGILDKWTEKRWANLWLSVPRTDSYASTVQAWDRIFRSLPAFERADGNRWSPVSLEHLMTLKGEILVAPLAEEKSNEVVKAALRLVRNTGRVVIRGIRRDQSWNKFAGTAFATTADLIAQVFASQLPPLVQLAPQAEEILATVARIAPLFTGPPSVDLVHLGPDSPPILRLRNRLVVNIDHTNGKEIVEDALDRNDGAEALIRIAASRAHEHLSEVAAALKGGPAQPEVLGPVRRRYIRSLLS